MQLGEALGPHLPESFVGGWVGKGSAPLRAPHSTPEARAIVWEEAGARKLRPGTESWLTPCGA